MVRLIIRKRIAKLNKEALSLAEKGDIKKAAEFLLRIDEDEQILKLLK